jgi:acetyl esterase
MKVLIAGAALCVLTMLVPCSAPAQAAVVSQPDTFTYRHVDGRDLKAYVFFPPGQREHSRANGILLFHGGAWNGGVPAWTFADARRFADSGLVAIAIEYRLSEGAVTPIEALSDVCAAFEWARGHADRLRLTDRVAGYGVSAGGHLVAATVTIGCPGESATHHFVPDALVLWSPALDVLPNSWFREKLQGRAPVAAYSPAEHVRASTPPTSIVQGDQDTTTPLSGTRLYCDRLIALGGTCELNVYEGVGHLLTRNLANQLAQFDPDPGFQADGIARQLRFLRRLGFIGAP